MVEWLPLLFQSILVKIAYLEELYNAFPSLVTFPITVLKTEEETTRENFYFKSKITGDNWKKRLQQWLEESQEMEFFFYKQ